MTGSTCRVCGASLDHPERNDEKRCPRCGATVDEVVGLAPGALIDKADLSGQSTPPEDFSGSISNISSTPFVPALPRTGPAGHVLDPDNPRWSGFAGIGVFFFSFFALVFFPLMFVVIWGVVSGVPGLIQDRDDFEAWVQSPEGTLVSVVGIFAAHLATLAVAWLVVSGGTRPFFQSLGWHWAGMSPRAATGMVAALVMGVIGLSVVLEQILPPTGPTPFELLLKSSAEVRYAVVIIAVLSAPLVEEVVYRGVLYSGLRKALNEWSAVALVSVLFALVHVVQYWGAWASLIGLTVLSLLLTILRARTRSLLPCVVVHTVFNVVGSIAILFSNQSS